MAEGVVHALEVIEVQIQHGEQPVLLVRGLQSADQAVARLLAVGEPGERIEIGQPHDAPLGAPLAAERDGHLPHFVRMEWLLEVRELVLGRHVAADLTRVRVGVRRADHDLERGIELAHPRRRPHAILAGGHAHVDECHREGLVARERLLDRGHRLARLLAEHRLEARCTRGRLAQPFRGIPAKQATAQLVKAGHLEIDFGVAEDLLVGVADLGLVVHDQYPNRRIAFSHDGPQVAPASAVSRAVSGTSRCSAAPRPGPSLAAQICPPSAPMALAHQCRPIPWLVSGDLVVKPFSNTRSRFSLGMPTPSSTHFRCSCGRSASRRISALTRSVPLSLPASRTASAALMMRFCSMRRSTVRATRTTPTRRMVSSASMRSRARQVSGTISSDCASNAGRRTGSMTCSLRAERICSARAAWMRLVWRVMVATSSCAERSVTASSLHASRTNSSRSALRCASAAPSRSSATACSASVTGAPRSRSARWARRTEMGVMALPRLCSTPLASSAKPA